MSKLYPTFTPPNSLREKIESRTIKKTNFFTISLSIPWYHIIIWSGIIATTFFIIWTLYTTSYNKGEYIWSNQKFNTDLTKEIHATLSMVDDINKDLSTDF